MILGWELSHRLSYNMSNRVYWELCRRICCVWTNGGKSEGTKWVPESHNVHHGVSHYQCVEVTCWSSDGPVWRISMVGSYLWGEFWRLGLTWGLAILGCWQETKRRETKRHEPQHSVLCGEEGCGQTLCIPFQVGGNIRSLNWVWKRATRFFEWRNLPPKTHCGDVESYILGHTSLKWQYFIKGGHAPGIL